MMGYQEYSGAIQEESEVSWHSLLLRACQENFKIQETSPLKKKMETGARPKWPGILELRFIERDTIHTLGGLALDLL